MEKIGKANIIGRFHLMQLNKCKECSQSHQMYKTNDALSSIPKSPRPIYLVNKKERTKTVHKVDENQKGRTKRIKCELKWKTT